MAEDSGQPRVSVNIDADHSRVRYAAGGVCVGQGESVIPVTKVANGWQITLMVAATLELLMAFFAIVEISFDRPSLRSIGGSISATRMVLDPMLALAALVLAHKGQVRETLLVFAGMIALGLLPFTHMLLYPSGIGAEIAFIILVPAHLIAITVAILAIRNRHLGLATVLAVVPTAFALVWKVAFAFSGPIRTL